MREEEFMQVTYWSAKANRLLGQLILKQEDNIKIDLREIGWDCIFWMHLAHIGASGGLL
jgi:hypothetical protein